MRLVLKICLVWLMMFGVSTSVWAQRSAAEIKGSQAVSPQVKSIKVVASFSILADMVKQIGGDAVEVVSMVGYGADACFFTYPSRRASNCSSEMGRDQWFGFRGVDESPHCGLRLQGPCVGGL